MSEIAPDYRHVAVAQGTARALRTPSHGHGLLAPRWQPGQSGNPGGQPKQLKEVRELAKIESVDALRALVACYKRPDGTLDTSADGRVVAVAAQGVLTWAFGRPPDYDPNEDKPPVGIDLSSLTLEQKKAFLALVRQTVTVEAAPEPAPDVSVAPATAPVIEARVELPHPARDPQYDIASQKAPTPKRGPGRPRKETAPPPEKLKPKRKAKRRGKVGRPRKPTPAPPPAPSLERAARNRARFKSPPPGPPPPPTPEAPAAPLRPRLNLF